MAFFSAGEGAGESIFIFARRVAESDLLFKHKEKSMKGCLVDALAIRGDEGRERLR